MTIAAGVLCTDGMVLCADTEHTITEDRKMQASKTKVWTMVYPSDDEDDIERDKDIRLTIGFTGAGYADWVEAFIQGVDRDILMDVPDGFDIEILEKQLEKYTYGFFEKYIKSYAENPANRPQAYMLILAQFADKHRAIFRVHENLTLKAEEQTVMAVGAGAPVFQSLAKLLLGEVPYHPTWKMKEAASIVTYIMEKVKSEVAGCGGNSHIVMIGMDGEQIEIPTRRIRELEIHHAEVEAKTYKRLADELVKKLP